MKKLLLLLSFVAFFCATFATSPISNEVDGNGYNIRIIRKGSFTGLFNLYKNVEIQIYPNGQIIMYCSGNGFNRCRLVMYSPGDITNEFNPDALAIETTINNLLDIIEIEADKGMLEGTMSKVIVIVDHLNPNRNQGKTIVFNAKWKFEESRNGDGEIEISYFDASDLIPTN